MDVAIYARISTSGQSDGASLETQIEAGREFAAKNDLRVVREVREIFSGSQLFERPRLNECRDNIRSGIYQGLIIYDIDRLSRSVPHLGILIDEFTRYNAKLFFVQSDFENSPEGMLLFSIRGYLAESERLKITERTTRGRIGKAKLGTLSFKRKLFGYYLDDEGKRRILESESETVKFIFSSFLSGKSLRAIAADLNESDIKPPAAKENSVWWAYSVAVILKNPAFAGRTVVFRQKRVTHFVKGERVNSTYHTPEESQVELPKGTTPPIVSEKDFLLAQKLLLSNKQSKRGEAKREFLLRGLVTCAVCGRNMSPQVSYKYRYYVCGSKQNPTANCKTKQMPAEKAETLVWAEALKYIKNPNRLAKMLLKANKKGGGQEKRDTLAITSRVIKVKREISNLVGRAGQVDDEIWIILKEKIAAKQKELADLVEMEAEAKEKLGSMPPMTENGMAALALKLIPKLNYLSFSDKVEALNMLEVSVNWDGERLAMFLGGGESLYGKGYFDSFYNIKIDTAQIRAFCTPL